MPRSKKLPDGVIRLDKLTPDDIKNNNVTCINIISRPENKGKLEFEGNWNAMVKALLWRLYVTCEPVFMKKLYNFKIMDKNFQLYREQVGTAKNGNTVYAEEILGTPYYVDYTCSDKDLCYKIGQLIKAMDLNPRDIQLTLVPSTDKV